VKSTKIALICAAGIVLLSGCASTQRALLAERCEVKVQPLMKFVALISAVPDPGRRVCGCISQRIDIAKAESAIAGKTGEARDAAVGALLIDNMPMIRDCARETGVLK
jgi:hypothetical protein